MSETDGMTATEKPVSKKRSASSKAKPAASKATKASTAPKTSAAKSTKKATAATAGVSATRSIKTPAPSKPAAVKPTPAILKSVQNEHKHLGVMANSLNEQLSQGSQADVNIMYDILHYINDFPAKFLQPKHDLIFNALLREQSTHKDLIDEIKHDRASLNKRSKQLLANVKNLRVHPEEFNAEKLSKQIEEFIDSLKSHIDRLETEVFPLCKKVISNDSWEHISQRAIYAEDPVFGQRVEDRYKALSSHMQERFVDAAEEFTLQQFFSFGAIFESIAPLAKGISGVKSVMGEHWSEIKSSNVECYKNLIQGKEDKRSDYIAKPLNCALDSYDTYVKGLVKVGAILRETQTEIYEPYETRIALFKEVDEEMHRNR